MEGPVLSLILFWHLKFYAIIVAVSMIFIYPAMEMLFKWPIATNIMPELKKKMFFSKIPGISQEK